MGEAFIRTALDAVVADLPAKRRGDAKRRLARELVAMHRDEGIDPRPAILRAAGIGTDPEFAMLGRLEELVALLPEGEEAAVHTLDLLFELAGRDKPEEPVFPELHQWLTSHVRAWYATRGRES